MRSLLAASVYAGMLAAKPLEVKLFSGYDSPFVRVAAAGVLGGAAGRAANVILIGGVAGNLPPPPPATSENVDQFFPDACKPPFAYRERLVVHGFEIANGCHGDSSPPN